MDISIKYGIMFRKVWQMTALALLVLACSNVMINNKWKIIRGKGIGGENQSFSYLFFNEKEGLLFGSQITDQDLIKRQLQNSDAVVYFSKDSGNNWQKQIMGKGDITCYAVLNRSVFMAIKATHPTGNDGSFTDSTKIYHSGDFGASWSEVSVLPGLFATNLFLSSEKNVCMIGKKVESKNWTVYSSEDTGHTWLELTSIPMEMYSPVLLHGDLFYLSHRDSESIGHFSSMTRLLDTLAAPGNDSKLYLLKVIDGQLYLAGTQKGKVLIYLYIPQSRQFRVMTEIDESKYPIDFSLIGNKVILLLGERNSVGVTYSIYSKDQQAQHWDSSPVPSSLFKPFTFTEKGIWGYSYDGNFYVMEFTE